MTIVRNLFAIATIAALTACAAGDSISSPLADASEARGGNGGGGGGATGSLRLTCEIRSGRSRISVDGNNLRPLNGRFASRVASGGNTASAGLKTATLDEVEFDYDSDPGDIAAGAVAIASNFIVVNASGPDVTAAILDASGNVVVSGGADCRTR